MESISAYLNLKDEDDYMYKKADARAKLRLEQYQRFSIIELLDEAVFTDDKIAKILATTILNVQNIKKDLAEARKKIARLKPTLSPVQIAEKLNLPVDWVERKLLEL